MFTILGFVRKWKQRYRKGLGPFDSVRYGLWLARG